jgi:Uma2 family endonuclease
MSSPKLEKKPRKKGEITGEALARIPNLGPCELVKGKIVLGSPTGATHGGSESRFCHVLQSFVMPRKLGEVLVGEVGIYTGRDPDTVRGADVVFISSDRYARRTREKAYLDVAPELVVEILSPGDRRKDVLQKIEEYFACGVLRVWIADPATRTIRVHRSPGESRLLGVDDDLTCDEVLPGFRVRVADLFGE